MKKYLLLLLFLLHYLNIVLAQNTDTIWSFPPNYRESSVYMLCKQQAFVESKRRKSGDDAQYPARIWKGEILAPIFYEGIYDTLGLDTIRLVPAQAYFKLPNNSVRVEGDTILQGKRANYILYPPQYKDSLIEKRIEGTMWRRNVYHKNCNLCQSRDKSQDIAITNYGLRTYHALSKVQTKAAFMIVKSPDFTDTLFFQAGKFPHAEKIEKEEVYYTTFKLKEIRPAYIVVEKQEIQLSLPTSDSLYHYEVALMPFEWRELVCCLHEGGSSNKVEDICQALKKKGYYKGKIPTELNVKVRAALVKFQKDNHLPLGRLDAETLKALGVKIE